MKTQITTRIVGGATAAFLTVALGTGCSMMHKKDEAPAPSPVAANAAAATNASQVTEISFDKGSATLSESSRQALTNLVNQTRAAGKKVDDIRVAAWSDSEYPSDRQEALPKQDRDLADKRADAVKDFLKSGLNVHDSVDTYNMAKQPGALAKAFNTSDVRVKQAFQSAGMPNSESGMTLSGKASKAVVMVVTE